MDRSCFTSLKDRLKKVVSKVANGNDQRAIILAGYLDSPEFLDYCKQDKLFKQDKTLDDQHEGVLRRLLREFYLKKNDAVWLRHTQAQAENLMGFTSANAKYTALNWTAGQVLEKHYELYHKAKINGKKLDRVSVISNIISNLEEDYIYNIIMPIYELAESKGENLDLVNDFAEAYNKVLDLSDQLEENPYEGIEDDLEDAKVEMMNVAYDFIEKYGNIKQKNYRQLIEHIFYNPQQWFKEVFNSSRLVNLVNEYNEALNSDKLYNGNAQDDNDVENDENDDRDLTSQAWEDKEWADYIKCLPMEFQIYFGSLYKLASPAKLTDTEFTYDTDNEVGVRTTMGTRFVLHQLLTNINNFNTIDEFIDDIVKLSQQIPECYGFIQIAQRCNKDVEFAKRLLVSLSNPKIIKTGITILEKGINVAQSNKESDAFTYTVFQMTNKAISVSKNGFDGSVISEFKTLAERIKSQADIVFYDTDSENLKLKYELLDNLLKILKPYYPNLNTVSLLSVLTKVPEGDTRTIQDIRIGFLNSIGSLLEKIQSIAETRTILVSEHIKNVREWNKKKDAAAEAGVSFDLENNPIPLINWDNWDTSPINSPIIDIANYLTKYTATQNKLNSVNAEGNLTSDITYNSYITNLFKQIAYDPDGQSQIGLQKLLDYISKGKQFDQNPLFWGVKNKQGKYIRKGLFERNGDTVTINKDAKKILAMSLFNGARLFDNSKSVMYSKMSKGDYFFTAMLAFYNPLSIGTNVQTKSTELQKGYAGYLMRTPSDKPNNVIVQAPKYSADKILTPIQKDIDDYVSKRLNDLNQLIGKNNSYSAWENINVDFPVSKALRNNVITSKNINTLYDIITKADEILHYDKLYSIQNNDGTVSIPFIYRAGNGSMNVIWIKGQKIIGETNRLLKNYDIDSITDFDGTNSLSIELSHDLRELFINEGLANGSIKTTVNQQEEIFYAIRQQLLGELNNFVDQLNNVFKKNKNGEWVIRKDINNLIDRAHYNITYDEKGNEQYLVQGKYLKWNKDPNERKLNPNAGKLSGNFFMFKKLFDTKGVNMQEVIESKFSLYGVGDESLLRGSKTKMAININHELIKIDGDRIVLNEYSEIVNNIITEITADWINNFAQEVNERSLQYSKLLEENKINDNQYNVLSFALNYANTYMSFDALFEGDVKFYKDAQDFLKRAKEVQAGGSIYTGYNVADDLSVEIKEVEGKNGTYEIKIGDITLSDFINAYSPVEGQIVNHQSSNARNGFRAITIHNTIRPSKYVNKIHKEVYDILIKKGLSEVEAEKIATQISSGFAANTKTNDAQSYITLEEFIRRRHADGTIEEYKEILTQIYEIRTGKRDYTDLDLTKINARIQLQKNFYYDQHFDTITRTYYPRQIKNAEFVIIPELVKGTDLEKLYNIMIKYDIGQVNTAETNKAAKRNILTFWDNDGVVNLEAFEKSVVANGQTSIENYYYRYLYKQQEVPEHMRDQANKAGVQIMKKIIDNADASVAEHVKKFFDNYCANIKDDFNKLIHNMGWKVNTDGSISNIDESKPTLDFTEFYERAKHEAQRLGFDENFIDYLTLDEFGSPLMPNYMNNVTTKLESIAQAIFTKAITRQTLPGWHAAQVTQIGHGRKVLDSNGKLRELRYHPENEDGSGNEAYAEVLIPRWSNLIPKDYSMEKLEKEGLDIQIAYRIPTEGKQSISTIKVVGFLDDVYGSTIMLPDEWVTQTGADFDIDSVYAVRHEIYKDEEGTIKKVLFDDEDSDKGVKRRYIRYVNNLLEKKLKRGEQESFDDYLYRVENTAEANNIISLYDFSKTSIEEQNTRAARNNAILDAMIAIMASDNSREENYSRSNFESITDSMKYCDGLRGASSVSRSTYNIFDQIDFFENATSGAALKAFSVTRDTFNSVNNYCKSVLSDNHVIKVEYDLKEYNEKTLVDAYGDDVDVKTKPGYAIVTHRRLGHSLNNRNVRGQLVTVYSSQTTAHILDSIKEGAIFNENMYTFGTFKTLIDLGIDYETAIAFLMQPAITEINEVNNETNSIYLSKGGKPIEIAIKRIATKAGFKLNGNNIVDYSTYKDVIDLLSKDTLFRRAIKELFGVELSDKMPLTDIKVSLNKSMLENRLKSSEIINNSVLSQEYKVIQDAAFDIVMALNFNSYRNTTNNLEAIMRCTNPDKFGAKQTIRATRMVKENIMEYGFNEKNEIYNTILVNNKPLLAALYPGFDKGNINVQDSAYPYLAAFMKYSTLPSININSLLFPTENEYFNRVLNYVQKQLGITFTDDQYREYKQYMMSDMYNSIAPLLQPFEIDEKGWILPNEKEVETASKNNTSYWNAERSRIFGYEETENLSLKIENIDKPTEEELKIWYRFTPAQKVMWLQMNTNVNNSIFKYLNVNLNNQWEIKQKGYSQQNITFNESAELIQEIYLAFNNSAYNKNPLVRSAVYDIVKYAFIVEGFKFKVGGLSKIITNKFLYGSIDKLGTNIISNLIKVFSEYSNIHTNATNNFINKFVRSHSEYVRTIKLDIPDSKGGTKNAAMLFNSCIRKDDNLVYIEFNSNNKELLNLLHYSTEGEGDFDGYIRFNRWVGKGKRKLTLYKVVKTNSGIYLIPLNLLERNEVADYSVNNDNNKYFDYSYYLQTIEVEQYNLLDYKYITKDGKEVVSKTEFQENSVIPRFVSSRRTIVEDTDYLDRISKYGTLIEQKSISKFINTVVDIVSDPVEGLFSKEIFSSDMNVAKHIPVGSSSIQKLIVNGETHIVEIVGLKRASKVTVEAAKNAGHINTKYYKVRRVVEEEIVEQYNKSLQEEQNPENYVRESITTTMDDIINDEIINESVGEFDIVNETMFKMLAELKKAERNGDENAAKIRKNLQLRNIRENIAQDLIDHRKNLYEYLAQYIEVKARLLNSRIEKYNLNGEEYNLSQKELYEALRDKHDEAEIIVKLLLESITFANTFGDIMTLPFDGVDEDTKKAINRIRNAIISVRNNKHVKTGFDLMFNNYIANEYATNPNIRLGITKLKDAFGDANWFETNIGDISMTTNKQIQTVVSLVNSILMTATEIDAPKKKREFISRFEAIEKKTGSFNWSNIIDSEGKLRRPYTDDWLKDKDALNSAMTSAKEQYGEFSVEYLTAKLERDEWYATNVHQIIVRDYYIDKNRLVKRVLTYAPTEYIEYLKLRKELYDGKSLGLATEAERNRKKDIQNRINNLISHFTYINGSPSIKSEEEIRRVDILANYITANNKLENEYIEYTESLGFKETLEIYLKTIENHKIKHPNMTLEQRLLDADFAEAYHWINMNSYYTVDKETKTALNAAYAVLGMNDKIDNDGRSIKHIIDKANAYDIYGNVDPTKLSETDIEEIYNITIGKLEDGLPTEARLIKWLPDGEIPVLNTAFYTQFRYPGEDKYTVERTKYKNIINELLRKVIDKDGSIRTEMMFNILTEEELETLANAYEGLDNIRETAKNESSKDKNNAEKIKARNNFLKNVTFKINPIFGSELSKARIKLNITQMALWERIFAKRDENGILVPNPDLFGYYIPNNDKYIDKKKTDAKKLIKENIEFEVTHYYLEASNKAQADGVYEEWYKRNHYFNPYANRMEPLRIWTVPRVIPTGSLQGSYKYVPTNEYAERSVIPEFVNEEYERHPKNYNIEGDSKYVNKSNLSPKELEMLDFLNETMDFFSKHNPHSKSFIDEGFIPRKIAEHIDGEFIARNILGTVGLEWRNDSQDRYYDKVDYENDREIYNDFLRLIPGKGYKSLEKIRLRSYDETEEDYEKYLKEVKARNEEIKKNNLKIDNALMSKDYKTVFAEAIAEQVIINARSKAKHWLYLLQEDIKTNESYKINALTGKLIKNTKINIDEYEDFVTTPQDNYLEMVHTFTRRVIYDQFKQRSKFNKWADVLKNVTSAKYMILNVTGGISNIATGFVNIMGEAFAGVHFTKKDLAKAVGMYTVNSVNMIADMYSDTTNNFAVGLTKYFNIVNFDDMSERVSGETIGTYIRRVRNSLYGLQSSGEHFMQNSVLFAVLMQNRIFTDVDGTKRVGTFEEYTWKLEWDALVATISDDNKLYNIFKKFMANIKFNKQEAYKYDTFRKSYIEAFLKAHCSKEIQKKYIKIKEELIATADAEWAKKPKAIDQFQIKDGAIQIIPGKDFNNDMYINLRKKAIGINKYIHGVYDKIGAARLEFHWWGSLVMQYHKHIYPGIMKRFRTKGYYDEQTKAINVGSYIALGRLLSKEYIDILNRTEGEEKDVLRSIRNIAKATVDTFINLKVNYKLMPEWERKAAKRALGDLLGMVSAMLMAISIYAMTDDDDEKESELVALGIYLSDRLLSESQMYTPWGMIGEASTLYSSPIAGTNSVEDLIKGIGFLTQWMFDDDYNPNYTTGLYAGKNKLTTILKNNIPMMRPINKIQNITRNNEYFRINEKSITLRSAKNIADNITED